MSLTDYLEYVDQEGSWRYSTTKYKSNIQVGSNFLKISISDLSELRVKRYHKDIDIVPCILLPLTWITCLELRPCTILASLNIYETMHSQENLCHITVGIQMGQISRKIPILISYKQNLSSPLSSLLTTLNFPIASCPKLKLNPENQHFDPPQCVSRKRLHSCTVHERCCSRFYTMQCPRFTVFNEVAEKKFYPKVQQYRIIKHNYFTSSGTHTKNSVFTGRKTSRSCKTWYLQNLCTRVLCWVHQERAEGVVVTRKSARTNLAPQSHN